MKNVHNFSNNLDHEGGSGELLQARNIIDAADKHGFGPDVIRKGVLDKLAGGLPKLVPKKVEPEGGSAGV